MSEYVNGMAFKDKRREWNTSNRNFDTQYYKGIPLKQINRAYGERKARRFTLNGTNQNVWIPLKHLHPCGTIKDNAVIDYVFSSATKQLWLAGLEIRYVPREDLK